MVSVAYDLCMRHTAWHIQYILQTDSRTIIYVACYTDMTIQAVSVHNIAYILFIHGSNDFRLSGFVRKSGFSACLLSLNVAPKSDYVLNRKVNKPPIKSDQLVFNHYSMQCFSLNWFHADMHTFEIWCWVAWLVSIVCFSAIDVCYITLRRVHMRRHVNRRMKIMFFRHWILFKNAIEYTKPYIHIHNIFIFNIHMRMVIYGYLTDCYMAPSGLHGVHRRLHTDNSEDSKTSHTWYWYYVFRAYTDLHLWKTSYFNQLCFVQYYNKLFRTLYFMRLAVEFNYDENGIKYAMD